MKGFAKSITVFLNGEGIHSADAFGQRITDSDFLILLNAHFEKIVFKPPVFKWKGQWIKVLDTAVEGFKKWFADRTTRYRFRAARWCCSSGTKRKMVLTEPCKCPIQDSRFYNL